MSDKERGQDAGTVPVIEFRCIRCGLTDPHCHCDKAEYPHVHRIKDPGGMPGPDDVIEWVVPALKRHQVTDHTEDGEQGWTCLIIFLDGKTTREGCWAYRYTPEYLVLNQWDNDTVIYPVPGSIREVHFLREDAEAKP